MVKKFLVLLAALFFSASILTNISYAAEKPFIKANKQYFDPARGLYVLTGDVCVSAKNRTATANQATFDPLSLNVWARGNITFTQDDIVFNGDDLYVYSNRKTAEISGNLCFKRDGMEITSDYGEYCWQTKVAKFSGHVIVTTSDGVQEYNALAYNVVENRFL